MNGSDDIQTGCRSLRLAIEAGHWQVAQAPGYKSVGKVIEEKSYKSS